MTVANRQEFGQTLTRLDGAYDLVANGGDIVTLRFERNGYLPVERSLSTQWQSHARVPGVVLTPLDPAVTNVDLTSTSGTQVIRGSEITDGDGTRRGTILVPEGTQAPRASRAQQRVMDDSLSRT